MILRGCYCAFSVIGTLFSVVAVPDARAVYEPGIEWEQPPVVTPGETSREAPSDATVLFDGSDLSAWDNGENWPVSNGTATVGKGSITTKQDFGNCQLHLEWSASTELDWKPQRRGNSGIFMMGRYEIQILNSFENKTYPDGQAGAVYKQQPPMVNVTRPPGQWNSFDVIWTRPRFKEDGALESPACVTLIHNGAVVQNNFQLQGDTSYGRPPRYTAHPARGPIVLQDHLGEKVRFRNIWVRELEPVAGHRVREPYLRDAKGNEQPLEAVSGG